MARLQVRHRSKNPRVREPLTSETGELVRSQLPDVFVCPRAIPMPSGDVGLYGGLSHFDDHGSLSMRRLGQWPSRILLSLSLGFIGSPVS